MARVTKWRRNIAENFNWLSRVHEIYRLTDNDRQICNGIYLNVTYSHLCNKQ